MKPSIEKIRQAIDVHGSNRAAARHLGIGEWDVRRALKRAEEDVELEAPAPEIDVNELIERRKIDFRAKQASKEYDKLINVKVKTDMPIGLGLFGDWHVDDDGTDIGRLSNDVDIFSNGQPGLYAGLLGDLYNNWVGKLARLWAEQSTSAEEAKALLEEFLQRVNWLFVVQGNHDAWAGHNNILNYILRNHTKINRPSRARISLNFSNGRSCKIFAAHDFPGKSQWSENYGIMKRALLDGQFDIYAAGDTHQSGYSIGTHEGTSRIFHAIRIASYKAYDRYADELNLQDRAAFSCPVAIIDPNADDLNFVRWELTPEEGAERLAWMRSRYERGKTVH
jgi:hypothetical protein